MEGREPDVRPEEAAEVERRGYLMFRVRSSLFALESAYIDHVSELGPVVRVPSAPELFEGVVHSRGRLLAVVSLSLLLGLESQARRAGARCLLVIEIDRRPFAAVADEILRFEEVPIDQLRDPGDRTAFVAAELDAPEGRVSVLRADALLEGLRRAVP